MKVRVGFSRTNGIVSRIIRWFLGSKVSHTYIRLDDRFLGTPLVFHADYVGVVIVHAPLFEKQNIVVEEYEIENDSFDYAIKKNLALLGKKYDYWNLLGWAWVIALKRWFKRKIENPIDDPKKLICVDFVLRITNCAKATNLPLGIMTPKELRKWYTENYESLGWKRISFEQYE